MFTCTLSRLRQVVTEPRLVSAMRHAAKVTRVGSEHDGIRDAFCVLRLIAVEVTQRDI